MWLIAIRLSDLTDFMNFAPSHVTIELTHMYKTAIIDVIGIHTHKEDAVRELTELKSLIRTFGGIDVVHHMQHRTQPDKRTFIGSGKTRELLESVKAKKLDIVIINAIVKPTQIFTLTKFLWQANPNIEVWDRIDLILHIFEKHATTAESKLQIEIAKMVHMGPRISGLGGTLFSRQSGGIGGRGQGETNTELMKRHWRTLIKNKKEELKKYADKRETQLARRKSLGIKHVALVGYTNAGKTTLFNALTGKQKIAQDALFVTLDSIVGKLPSNQGEKSILVSDTIGFIQNLPPSLIETFKSTLMDVVNADLILHVIDVSDPKRERNIEVVREILSEIGAVTHPQMIVFTKSDKLPEKEWGQFSTLKKQFAFLRPIFISSTESINIDKLLTVIKNTV